MTLISRRVVAETLGVSGDTVRRIVEEGCLPAYRVGKRMRFDVSDVENYLYENRLNGEKYDAVANDK